MATLTLIQKIGTQPIVLYLRFVTIASITFENAKADVDAKDPFTRYDLLFLHAILWKCSHSAMVVVAICNVFILESHRMGVEPIHVWHRHWHHCIARTGNRTMWTVSLTCTQSIFCIANAKKKTAPCERALSVNGSLLSNQIQFKTFPILFSQVYLCVVTSPILIRSQSL